MFNSTLHSVPIWNFHPCQPELEGTGVFVGVDDHRFVITAAHVVEKADGEFAFGYLKNDGDFELHGDKRPPILKANDQSGKNDPRTAVYAHGIDLAVICLSREIRHWLEERYQPFDFMKNPPAKQLDFYFISGWPVRRNQFNVRREYPLGSKPGCYHIQTPAAPSGRVEKIGGIPEVHFALEINRRKDFREQETDKHLNLFELTGMSGSGVWGMEQQSNVPLPCCAQCLAGILIEYHENKKLALVLKIDRFSAALEEAVAKENLWSRARPSGT